MPSYSESETETGNANEWFKEKFPDAAKTYGPAFMEATVVDPDGVKQFIPAFLNDDFFAGILGGDSRLGHKVVYFAPEDTFYFYDPRVDAFCVTSEEKLKLLLSNYLVRCSQECGALTDITNMVVKFRQDDVLKRVVQKAKAILEADRDFFSGKDGKKRMVTGKLVNPKDPPAHETFIKEAIVQEPDAALTVTECYHTYYRFCHSSGINPPTRKEFQALVVEAIRAAFNIGLRHDVPGPNGKQANGWLGITCRSLDTLEVAGRN